MGVNDWNTPLDDAILSLLGDMTIPHPDIIWDIAANLKARNAEPKNDNDWEDSLNKSIVTILWDMTTPNPDLISDIVKHVKKKPTIFPPAND